MLPLCVYMLCCTLKDTIILPQCEAYGGKVCLFVAIGIAGKFGGLAVSVETAKFKSTNIIFTHNVIHALALLALPSTPLRELYR